MSQLRLAVLGDPVAHSRSPELHRGFLAEAGIDGSYEAIRVAAGTLATRLPELVGAGFTGFNVTTPLKDEAFALASEADETATFARAANTLVVRDGRIVAANTDGVGAVAALRAAAGEGGDARVVVVVLGGGGTARAAISAFASSGFDVALWTRRVDVAHEILGELARREPLGALHHLDALRARTARIDDSPWPPLRHPVHVFATLPPGAVLPTTLRALVGRATVVVDANYGSRSTLGAALGRTDVHDGRVMLEAQARASFRIFISRTGR